MNQLNDFLQEILPAVIWTVIYKNSDVPSDLIYSYNVFTYPNSHISFVLAPPPPIVTSKPLPHATRASVTSKRGLLSSLHPAYETLHLEAPIIYHRIQ